MVQEYMSLDEAAEALGLSKDDLVQRAQRREIRAFADRGSWKFRKKDIEEHVRQSGIGSGAEIVFGDPGDDDSASIDSGSSDEILLNEQLGEEPGGSGARVIGMDDQGRTPSDSDVRLVPDDILTQGSDSDVKLVAEGTPPSDSDVKLVPGSSDSGDSDVKIKGPAPTDSDVRLEKSEQPGDSGLELESDDDKMTQDMPVLGDSQELGSDFELEEGGSDSEFDLDSSSVTDSDMTLALDDAVGIKSDDEIDISPKSPSDSDVTRHSPSSSGLSLDSPADSGIALDAPLEDVGSSGLDLGTDASSGSGDDMFTTDFGVPELDSDDDFGLTDDSNMDTAQISADSDFALSDADLDFGSDDTQQVLDVEEEEEVDDSASTRLGDVAAVDEEWVDDQDAEAIDDFEEIEDEIPGEEAAYDDGGETAPAVIQKAAQPQWGLGWVITLGFSTFVMLIGMILVNDLVQTMWGWEEGIEYSTPILDLLGGMFP